MRIAAFLVLPLLAAGCVTGGATRAKPGTVQHVVFFKFKEGLPATKVDEVVAEFRKLPGKIPGIVGFQEGPDMSTENLQKGFTHAFIVTFADRKARDAYLTHPAHDAFKQTALPAIADVCVLDFVVGPPPAKTS